ncbi:predicted protein [Plenodomus lingam JN3]|uniref:Predicted protein n=1 Tax=Leptosphaeria maculans (strain JN3 / isolate v23.1.3 / race Av1-4-5-6-7-8) TaxID=985895 RepID=E4ZN28_LEPMJ|nr:predicted protein [Plenodomus lingam JN3]CBX92631.1 predicted protein [Plenodomus lingam JN3]
MHAPRRRWAAGGWRLAAGRLEGGKTVSPCLPKTRIKGQQAAEICRR